jgi:hypothetical protein
LLCSTADLLLDCLETPFQLQKSSKVLMKTECVNDLIPRSILQSTLQRGADKSLADQEGNKIMFLSEWREFPSAPCLVGVGELDDSSRLDVVDIARVPNMLPSLLPSWSG